MCMSNKVYVLIADSGSTKTDWCLKKGSGETLGFFTTSGINPSLQDTDEIESVFVRELVPNIPDMKEIRRVLFYGAGCTLQRKGIVSDAFAKVGFNDSELVVESDMLGAAKAVCGDSPGVVGILGTGSNSCVYDGEKIVANTPSLGFVLGDEGSGAYIGKRLVGDCLKGVMSKRVCETFMGEMGLDVATVVQKVYKEAAPNRFLAGLSRFCAQHLDEPEICLLLVDCFEQFFRRNILQYEGLSGGVRLIGSIAEVYKVQVQEAAQNCSLVIDRIMRSPIEGLAKNQIY